MSSGIRVKSLFFIIIASALIGFGVAFIMRESKVSYVDGIRSEQAAQIQELYTQNRETSRRAQLLVEQLAVLQNTTKSQSELVEAVSTDLESTRKALDLAKSRLSSYVENRSVDDTSPNDTTPSGDPEQTLEEIASRNDNLEQAIFIQAELLSLFNDKLKPLLGDGTLLFQQGLRAVEHSDFMSAATYFEESGSALNMAKHEAQRIANKQKDLLLVIPSELRQKFITSQKISEATIFLTDAQAIAYSAAAPLYRIIGEWQSDQSRDPQDINRWRILVESADDDLEQALDALEEADKWAPNVWRQFEAARIEIRRIQGLSTSIHNLILRE